MCRNIIPYYSHLSTVSIPYSYRYGFCAKQGEERAVSFAIPRYSGKRQERELSLNQSITSAEYWFYDGRLGRRWNVDPIFKEYESPYSTFGNNPICFIDPNGADSIVVNDNGTINSVFKKEGDRSVYSTTGELFKINTTNEEERKLTQKQIDDILPEESSRYTYEYNKEGYEVPFFFSIPDYQIRLYMDEAEVKNISYNLFAQWARGTGKYDFLIPLYYDYYRGYFRDEGVFRVKYPDFKGPFLKFGNQKMLYNMYDAGNFLTGKAFQLSSVNWSTLKLGTNLYHWKSLGDSKADKNALKNGYDYYLEYTIKK